jgi:hypothetical protein
VGECVHPGGSPIFQPASPQAIIDGQIVPLQGYLAPCGFDPIDINSDKGQSVAVAVAEGGAIVLEGEKTVALPNGGNSTNLASCLLTSANGHPPFTPKPL